MATKKQKREISQKNHVKFMAEIKRSGLEAQHRDRESRQKKARQDWQKQHDEKHSWKNLVKECPLCTDKLNASKKSK